ncbi:MAG: hypothetical protein PVI90_14405, partial [Desulfobacteraceae bacterium]
MHIIYFRVHKIYNQISLFILIVTVVLFSFVDIAVAQNKLITVSNKANETTNERLDDNDKYIENSSDDVDPQEMEFSEENLIFLPQDEQETDGIRRTGKRYWQKFRQDFNSILTLDYGYAYQFGEPERTVLNRSSIRLELGRLFSKRHYAKLDGKLTVFGADDHFVRAKGRSMQLDGTLREAYLESSFDKITIKAGKQILIWGESDTAIVTDLVSPRDISELNFKSIEDSRISQTMIVLNAFSSFGSWNFFLNPDPATDDLADEGTEYYTIVPMPSDFVELKENKPDVDDTEFGLRWKRTFGQSDVAIMAADLVENQPMITFKSFTDTNEKMLAKEYNRFQMLGFASSFAWENFIWKAEMAYSWDRSYQRSDNDTGYAAAKSDTFDIAAGLEYASTSRLWSITLEAAN